MDEIGIPFEALLQEQVSGADGDDASGGDDPLLIDLVGGDGKKKSQATILIELSELATYFLDADREVYAVLGTGHRDVWRVRSAPYKEWLSASFYALTLKGCNQNAVSDAITTIEAKAKATSPTHPVYLRVAKLADRIVIDIGSDDWNAIEVDAHGWRVVQEPPVYFVRRKGMAALPIPRNGGSVETLRDFLNIDHGDFPLVVGWLLAALGGAKPYPVLVLQGEQGTAKSTTCRVLRSLVDPSSVPLRTPPREVRDLLVSAVNNHLVLLDNLSGIAPEISDALCRLSTGGGIDCRALYTDTEQVLIDIQRPIVVNGIDDLATRPDLSERSIVLALPFIEDTRRRDESEFWQCFTDMAPSMLGALLDALSVAIRRRPTVRPARLPRMADFALLVTAAEPALGLADGDFLRAFDANQTEAFEAGLEASPVGAALLKLLEDCFKWSGTPTELCNELARLAGDQARSKAWPASPKGLKNAVTRLRPALRRMGINIMNGRSAGRFYEITRGPLQATKPTEPTISDRNQTLSHVTSQRNFVTSTHSPVTSTHGSTHNEPLEATAGAAFDTSVGFVTYSGPSVNGAPDSAGDGLPSESRRRLLAYFDLKGECNIATIDGVMTACENDPSTLAAWMKTADKALPPIKRSGEQ